MAVACKTERVTSATDTIDVVQLSDTHFLEDGAPPEGGFAYDTSDAFEAVRGHVAATGVPDLVVVTGDVADHGRADQYRQAADAFSSLDAPVNVCPGNHDQDATFTTAIGRRTVSTSRAIEIGNWCFLFVDSNAGVMIAHESGRFVDPAEYDDRLHGNGSLGMREASWIRDACAATAAEHVFIWLHHPPGAPVGLSRDHDYDAEWRNLVGDLAKLRGMGGGHTHVPDHYEFEGCEVFVCPALKNNFDLDAKTMLPPGYRRYRFSPDGTISGHVELIDDVRWPRNPLGRAVMSLLHGELSWHEFDAIVARKRVQA